MKKFAMIALAAMTAFATPAMAQDFSGPRVGATVGYADGEGDDFVTYGGIAGYDIQTANGMVFGLTGEYIESNDTGRNLVATARAGKIFGGTNLVYAMGGYTNLGAEDVDFNIDGYRVGAGLEKSYGKMFAAVEYAYDNYEYDIDGHQGRLVVGLRF